MTISSQNICNMGYHFGFIGCIESKSYGNKMLL